MANTSSELPSRVLTLPGAGTVVVVRELKPARAVREGGEAKRSEAGS